MKNRTAPPTNRSKRNRSPAASVLNQPPGPSQDGFGWFGAVVLLAIAGGLLWTVFGRQLSSQTPNPMLASIAETGVPTTSFSEELPASANNAMMSLVRGDCQTASAQFRTARRGMPGLKRLGVMEGASLICAGAADEARDTLELIATDDAPPQQVWWYLAQSCLLQADADCAQVALNQSILVDRRHRRQAEQQLRQLQSIQAQR